MIAEMKEPKEIKCKETKEAEVEGKKEPLPTPIAVDAPPIASTSVQQAPFVQRSIRVLFLHICTSFHLDKN